LPISTEANRTPSAPSGGETRSSPHADFAKWSDIDKDLAKVILSSSVGDEAVSDLACDELSARMDIYPEDLTEILGNMSSDIAQRPETLEAGDITLVKTLCSFKADGRLNEIIKNVASAKGQALVLVLMEGYYQRKSNGQ
jgi:hypothetical protein